MSQKFLAEIRMFAGNFAPRGWMFCQGQILSISQNTALFSLIGTTYGGNGQTTFALPDLRGRVPVGVGQGPGLPSVVQGELAGAPSTTLLITNMPAHTHPVTPTAVPAFTGLGTLREPSATAVPAGSDQRNAQYAPAANADTQLGPASTPSTGITGGSQPFSTMQPYLGMHYIIAVEGIFPSRN